jgi:hypothetical protein
MGVFNVRPTILFKTLCGARHLGARGVCLSRMLRATPTDSFTALSKGETLYEQSAEL